MPDFRLDVGQAGESAGERVAALASNPTGFQNMTDPVYGGAPTVMFYAGDDGEAKRLAHRLVTDLGFDVGVGY